MENFNMGWEFCWIALTPLDMLLFLLYLAYRKCRGLPWLWEEDSEVDLEG
jgi:hypothetical protein